MPTPRLCRVLAAFTLLAPLFPVAGRAQWTSSYEWVNLAGDFNGWDTLSTNLVLIGDGVWQGYHSCATPSIAFKFATADFGERVWGEDNQADFAVPIAAVAENPGASNIVVDGVLGRTLRFRLDENANTYRVDDVSPVFAPWINEVDYDNIGTDSNEWIELAGPAGLSLDDYRLALVNQAGSTYASFDLAAAAFTFANEADGVGFFVVGITPAEFGAADFVPAGWDANEIQNGPADSILLQRKTGAVNVHLIDYGATNAFTVEDQVVLAVDDGAADRSVYLTGGPGGEFSSFNWTNTANRQTPGAANVGQSFATPASGVAIGGVASDPAIPNADAPVHIEAELTPVNGASNLAATVFYRADGAGSYLPLAMAPAGGSTWRTLLPVPGQPAGTLVEYYLFVAFDGFGTASPVLSPANAPDTAYAFGVPRLPAGAVWLNEINYRFDFFAGAATNEYLELAGPAGADLGGWRVELFDTSVNYAGYTVPAGSQLSDDGTGHGFLVLGDPGVPGVDIVFTNEISSGRSLSETGAIRLVNELGFVEATYTYSFPQTNRYPGAIFIGDDDDFVFADQSLGLQGTGSGYAAFSWGVNAVLTPGAANQGQTLIPGGVAPEPPEVVILGIRRIGGTVEIVSTGTNGWSVIGEYAADLRAGEAGWLPLNRISNSYADGINTTLFDLPAGAGPVLHFRIRQTGDGPVPPPVVRIVASGFTTTEIHLVSTGNATWPVTGEYTTDLRAGETGWLPLTRIGNTHDGGTNTTVFARPAAGASAVHFRVSQTPP